METNEFISDLEGTTSSPYPSPGSSSCNSICKYPVMYSTMMAVLVSLAIIAGLVICLHPRSPQVSEDSCSEKINVTCFIEKETSDNGNQYEYRICKIPKTGAYLIHGHEEEMTPLLSVGEIDSSDA
ncbi:hypothetical protein GN956_G13979 [Arapaima gigas]